MIAGVGVEVDAVQDVVIPDLRCLTRALTRTDEDAGFIDERGVGFRPRNLFNGVEAITMQQRDFGFTEIVSRRGL